MFSVANWSSFNAANTDKFYSSISLFPLFCLPLYFVACTFFFLWLYSPILGLGRLHETFCFISVTWSRTEGRTPWAGDQLVARPLLTALGDCDDGEIGGMNGFGRGNRSTRRKSASTPFCPLQIPLARPGREPGPPETNHFSYGVAV
jgi:hypothetical protein